MELYDVSVRSYLQNMEAIDTCFDKGEKFFDSQGSDFEGLVSSSLHSTMLPFHFQVISLNHFSLGAINAAKSGGIGGPDLSINLDYMGLRDYLQDTITELQGFQSDKINALSGGEVIFQHEEMTLPFTTDDFFLTYAVPNYYFHATIVYALFRAAGVPVGIANFQGKVDTTDSLKLASDVDQWNGSRFLKWLNTLSG